MAPIIGPVSVGSSLAPSLAELGNRLRDARLTVAVAESCTGGLLGAALTDLPDASAIFLGGAITYTADTKARVLGVDRRTLDTEGAVSAATAAEMAAGVAKRFGADVGLSVTGVAGPTSEEGKPVGLCYVGAWLRGESTVKEMSFSGGRASNRVACVEAALDLGLEVLDRSLAAGGGRAVHST
jgi:nicotinamide-nucleotide amidase